MRLALSQMRGRGWHVPAVVTAAWLSCAGCGGPGSPARPASIPLMPASANYSGRLASVWLTAALAARHVTGTPTLRTIRSGCPLRSQSVVSEVIRAPAATPTTMAAMHTEVATVLRSAGWRVAPVPASKIPRIGLMLRHPIDEIAKGTLRGAVNILPDRRTGTYALIFINSGCRPTRRLS